jgi:membrane protein
VTAVARAAWQEWKRDNAMMLAAAVAFYAIFSLAPLLLLVLNAGALFYGRTAARAELLEFVGHTVGSGASRAVGRVLAAAAESNAGATAISVVLLLLGASAVFRHLKTALNLVLDVPTPEQRGILRYLRSRLFAAAAAVSGIVVLIGALGVTAGLAWLRVNAPEVVGRAPALWRGGEVLVSFVVLVVIFGAILKFVPDMALTWRSTGLASALAAIVFTCGQLLIGLYVARVRFTAAYGAAGSVVLLLVYVYFAVAVILAAAELMEVLARRDDEFRDQRRRLQKEQHYQPRKQD